MSQINKTISEYLNSVAEVHGPAYRNLTSIRHAGGSDVIIEFPEGHKSSVSLGRLRLMSRQLQKKAA